VGATEELPSIVNQPTHQLQHCNCNDNIRIDTHVKESNHQSQTTSPFQHIINNKFDKRIQTYNMQYNSTLKTEENK